MKTSTLPALLRLMRPKQWVKNGFVFAPAIFAAAHYQWWELWQVVVAFFLFCAASAATYVLNDICDVEQDREHPKKRHTRPLAAGQASVFSAKCLLGFLYLVILSGLIYQPEATAVILAYMVLNIAYSYYLKHVAIVDIFTIAVGFVLRVIAGTVALGLPLSEWMFVTTFSLALFLAASKREKELQLAGKNTTRKVLNAYSYDLVRSYCLISATCSLMFYCFFVLTQNVQLVITIPFVMFGIFRFWLLTESLEPSQSPTEALVTDWPLIVTVLIWATLCVTIIHFR
jgi:4-hydroxybenzoate polyprenyltransferase